MRDTTRYRRTTQANPPNMHAGAGTAFDTHTVTRWLGSCRFWDAIAVAGVGLAVSMHMGAVSAVGVGVCCLSRMAASISAAFTGPVWPGFSLSKVGTTSTLDGGLSGSAGFKSTSSLTGHCVGMCDPSARLANIPAGTAVLALDSWLRFIVMLTEFIVPKSQSICTFNQSRALELPTIRVIGGFGSQEILHSERFMDVTHGWRNKTVRHVQIHGLAHL